MKEININDIEVLWDKDSINKQVKRVAKEINEKFISEKSVNLIPIMTGGLMFVSNLIAELEILRTGCYHMFPLIAKTYGNSTESQGTTIYGYDFLAENIDIDSPSVIVDDLMDSGETLYNLTEKLEITSNFFIKNYINLFN